MSGDPTSSFRPPLTGEHAAALLDLGFETLPPEPAIAGEECEDKPGDLIARYRLIEPIGEGGFGFVWSAEQTEPIHRVIALKLIRRGMNSREIVARFGAESQALALMDHPHIAAVLDAGTTADGRPFFAMELVRGEPLTSYCDSRSLDLRERIELFIPVCQAVQHAHQKAILHRDLKPSNILVAEIDGKAVPKVIDFGIAKALGATPEAALDASLLQTRAGAILGTLQYMSPEQAGSVSDVDTRSDIYSLGVILYELLTGSTPLSLGVGKDEAYDETLRRIRTEEAPRPSTVVQPPRVVEGARGMDLSRLRRALRGDLDWIAVKALEKDRRRRYETATALATDLRRHLNREPVSAAAPTWSYQFSKFARRNQVAFTSAGIVAATLVAATAVSLNQAARAKRESEKAAENARAAEHNRALAEANQAKARAAVDQFLNKITEDPRMREADFTNLRRSLLEEAVPFYEELSSGNSPGGEVTVERAASLNRLGLLYHELGQSEKAIPFYHRQIAMVDQLMAAHPEEILHRQSRMAGYNNLAAALGELKDTPAAIDAQRHALETVRGLVRDYPQDEENRTHLITLLTNLATMLSLQDVDHAEAVVLMREALAESDRVIRDFPDNEMHQRQRGYVHSNLALTLHNNNDPSGEAEFRIARGLQDRWVAEHPEDREERKLLATTTLNLGHLLTFANRFEEAMPFLRESAAHSDRLAGELPSVPEHASGAAMCRCLLGLCLLRLDRGWEAEPELKAAAAVHHRLAEQFPIVPEHPGREAIALDILGALKRKDRDWAAARDYYLKSLACHRRADELRPPSPSDHNFTGERLDSMASTAIEQGDTDLAVSDAMKIPDTGQRRWSEAHAAAVLVAKAVAADLANAELPEAERRARADRHAAVAISMLQQAIERGSPHVPDLAGFENLAPLRGYPGFRDLKELPAAEAGQGPRRFIFDYPHEDPGPRHWILSGETWQETQPSGKRSEFRVVKRIRNRGVSGTEIVNKANADMRLFVPDKDSAPPLQLRMYFPDTKWQPIGEIREVE
jgi:serine/threonine protein kinase